MDGSCSILSDYLNSSQCLDGTGGAEVVLFTSLISTLIQANLQLGNPNDYPPDASSHLLNDYPPDASSHLLNDYPQDASSYVVNKYDFIVIGAGSAGSVVASRLSEVKQWNVLLIEAGADPTPSTDVPGLFISSINTEIDWQYRTHPDNNACLGFKNQQCRWPRGKVLGGSSTLNNMMYIRGNKLDYDYWEQMGNVGWSYKDVLPYFKKSEGNRDKKYISEHSEGTYYHSSKGLLSVETFEKFYHEKYYLKAVKELEYDVLKDLNGPNQLGFAHIQGTLKNATRCNTAKAFLSPARLRKNLHVSKYSQVMKINVDPASKQAVSVTFRTSEGKIVNIKFKKEVIVSGGSVNSPQILMLSGIGPKEHLEEIGIDVIQNLPVGKNLQDHLFFIGSVFAANKTANNNDAMYDYLTKRKGPLTTTAGSFTGFIRTNYSDDERPDLQIQPFVLRSNDQDRLHMLGDLFGFTDDTFKSLQNIIQEKDILIMAPALLHPKSAGEILLNSSNPFDRPQIHPGYLSEEIDVKVLLEGIKFSVKFMNTKSMQADGSTRKKLFVKGCENLQFDSEGYWICMLKHVASTMFHPVGTCKMGPSSDLTAVVDPELKVHGVKGIRVVDASIMPNIISGNTNAPTIMIGEKGSDLIKKDWL